MFSMTASLLLSAFVQTCLVTCKRNRCDSNCWIITPSHLKWRWYEDGAILLLLFMGPILFLGLCCWRLLALHKGCALPSPFFHMLQLHALPLSCCKAVHKCAGMKQPDKRRWCDNSLKAELLVFSCYCVRILTCFVMHVGQSLEIWI